MRLLIAVYKISDSQTLEVRRHTTLQPCGSLVSIFSLCGANIGDFEQEIPIGLTKSSDNIHVMERNIHRRLNVKLNFAKSDI